MRRVTMIIVACSLTFALKFPSSPDIATGALSGNVTDEKGTPLRGVLIRLINVDRQISTSVVTGASGRYSAPSLFPGNYEIRGERKGFETAVKTGVRLDSQTSAIDLVLKKRDTVASHPTSDLFAQFPEDPDKALVFDTCLRCHSMMDVVLRRKEPEDWRKVVEVMAPRRRSDITAAEINRLVSYFSKHFNTSRPVAPFATEPEPPPDGTNVRVTEYGIPDQGKPEVIVPSANSAPIFPHNITVTSEGIVWFAMFKANKIGRLDPRRGEFRSYPVPTPGSVPHGITVALDGSIWFTEARGSQVGHLNPETGVIREVPTNSGGNTIVRDSKGNMYLTMGGTNQIGKVNTKTYESTAYDLLTPRAAPYGIVVDQKDQVWWCQRDADSIGKLDPKTGKITEYATPTKSSAPRRLAVDEGGNIWFGEWRTGKLGKLDPKMGKITEYDLPTPHSEPYEVAVDSDNAIWVAGYLSNTLARFDPVRETFVEYPIPTPRGEIRKMVADPKQGIWFAESHTDTIGHIVVKR